MWVQCGCTYVPALEPVVIDLRRRLLLPRLRHRQLRLCTSVVRRWLARAGGEVREEIKSVETTTDSEVLVAEPNV